MLPRPSVCLNVPKTGSTFSNRFLDAADWLHLRRACGLTRLRVPNRAEIEIVRPIKRYALTFGSLNCRLWDHHAGYSTWPESLRGYPRLCTLRDVHSWYCSFYLYYTRSMTHTLLAKTIRLLVDGDGRGCDPDLRAIAHTHRRAFLERFEPEQASADSIRNVSVPFLLWFLRAVRIPYMLRRWVGIDTCREPMGFLTFRTITLLFENPARVFAMDAGEIRAYFDSGRYRRDLRCDFFLPFDTLAEALSSLMCDELGYRRDIVEFLKKRSVPRNVSPAKSKPRIMQTLAEDGLLRRIRRDEFIYERYLLPLAGCPAAAPRPDQSARPRPGRDAAFGDTTVRP